MVNAVDDKDHETMAAALITFFAITFLNINKISSVTSYGVIPASHGASAGLDHSGQSAP
jgi:hypothetical protein